MSDDIYKPDREPTFSTWLDDAKALVAMGAQTIDVDTVKGLIQELEDADDRATLFHSKLELSKSNYEAGALDERAKIVAWGREVFGGRYARRNHLAVSNFLDAIERGEHLK